MFSINAKSSADSGYETLGYTNHNPDTVSSTDCNGAKLGTADGTSLAEDGGVTGTILVGGSVTGAIAGGAVVGDSVVGDIVVGVAVGTGTGTTIGGAIGVGTGTTIGGGTTGASVGVRVGATTATGTGTGATGGSVTGAIGAGSGAAVGSGVRKGLGVPPNEGGNNEPNAGDVVCPLTPPC
jgi:hypothetical protein